MTKTEILGLILIVFLAILLIWVTNPKVKDTNEEENHIYPYGVRP